MATFSPVPSPRKTTRRTPLPPASSPPAPQAYRRARLGSLPASRHATPVRGSNRLLAVGGSFSPPSEMDIDEKSPAPVERSTPKMDTVFFARSEELSVSFYAHLPLEVKQVLKNADFLVDAYTGDIDTLTGFALVASVRTCFVWQYAQALKATPTCYIFSCPPNSAHREAPFHALVPCGQSREPGLILVSVEGQIRFWESIGIGLAGGDHYSTNDLRLINENVTNFVRSDPQTFILSTSNGRLFRITLTSSGGKYHLTFHPFSRPQSSLSLARLLPSLWSSGHTLQPESGYINAVALGEETSIGKDVWVLIDTRIQRWNMSVEGWEEIELDEHLVGLVLPVLRRTFLSAPKEDSDLDLEFLDLALDSFGKLYILLSFAGKEEDVSMDIGGGPRRIYAVLCISYGSESLTVQNLRDVPYQSTTRSGAPVHARIQLISDGLLVSIQFGDAIALCAIGSDYSDRLELKSVSDRTLGVGVLEDESGLLVLTAATMMKAYVDMDQVAMFDPEMGKANLIKSTMMQAILYGSLPENPLHFSFPPEVDEESLMLGAEQLSQAVLQSDHEIIRPNHDMSAHLTERKGRLSWLIRFINDNAVLVKMSQSSRQKLATDAEKLYACHQLWLQYNNLLASGHGSDILHKAIFGYMREIDQDDQDDLVRAFFKSKVGDIGRLLQRVADIITKDVYKVDADLLNLLPEANGIVLTVLKSALDYREYNLAVYGIELPMVKPWTSKPYVIEIVLSLFDTTTKLVESSGASDGTGTTSELGGQLPELASILFACVWERLEWLGSDAAAADPTIKRDHKELEDKFDQLRPEVLDTLRSTGHTEEAFTLAEKYRDFQSLASLCHKDKIYPPQENPNVERIQSYVDRFKEQFTTELYRWYIEHGELRTLFAQDEVHSNYMDKFFAENSHPSISWIHDLGKGRYGAASVCLLDDSRVATELSSKHLMLSIGKLAHLAQLSEGEASIDESVLNAFHDDLDFVSVHQTLEEEFRTVLASVRGKQSLDAQADTIATSKAAAIADKGALTNVFKRLVRQLLQGKALSIEDAVDILTLKDNAGNNEDYITALQLLSRDQVLPDSRRLSAFRSTWRRIYIHDDWVSIRQTAGVTDNELNERLKNTAMFAAIRAVLPERHHPEGYDLFPDQALPTPSVSEISTRWPGMAPDQVEALELDYKEESITLEHLKLDDVYNRVRELAVRDAVWGSGL